MALPSLEARRGAFGLSSHALILVAGIAEDFSLRLLEMSDPIPLTPQGCQREVGTPAAPSVGLVGAGEKQ